MAEEKKPILSWDTILKYSIYLVMAAICYANLNGKTDNNTEALKRIEATQKDASKDHKDEMKEWDLQRAAMQIQINACDLQIKLIQQRLDDGKHSK